MTLWFILILIREMISIMCPPCIETTLLCFALCSFSLLQTVRPLRPIQDRPVMSHRSAG